MVCAISEVKASNLFEARRNLEGRLWKKQNLIEEAIGMGGCEIRVDAEVAICKEVLIAATAMNDKLLQLAERTEKDTKLTVELDMWPG